MIRQLRRAAFDRGFLGGSRSWVLLGAALWAARGLRVAWRRQGGVAWRGVIAEGESITVQARRGGPRGRGAR